MNMLIWNQFINVMITWFVGLIVYGFFAVIITIPLMRIFKTQIVDK